MIQLEHPAITQALRTGYPRIQSKVLVCSYCNQEIAAGEVYGECDGKTVCVDCLDGEWNELNPSEKIVHLGLDLKYNG